jgi:c-di-GMP-binding flagellar brake protein YcgR
MILPRVGQPVHLSLVSASDEIGSQPFKSRIADLQGDIASIELPISEKTGRTGLFPIGSVCDVWYIGEDGARYEFRAEIVGRQSEQIPLLLMKLPPKEHVKRTQRRNYMRINTSVEIAVKTEDKIRNYHFLARTESLSGGGLSFACEEKYRFKEGDRLHIWLSLPSKTGSVAHAFAVMEIVRIRQPEEPDKPQLIYGKFVRINESDRAKIVRACYERQLELRKKGIAE